MFAKGKAVPLLVNLANCSQCLIFVDDLSAVPEGLKQNHCFVQCEDPERAYGELTKRFWQKEQEKESQMKYTQMPGGYAVGEGAEIGENVVIEPFALIGHGVKIGSSTRVEAGAKIYHAEIGQNCFIMAGAVIGTQSFFHYKDETMYKHMLHQLGRVVIEDDVEIGANSIVSRSVAGVTRVCKNAKIDDLAYVPHDCEIGEGARLLGGVSLGGFCRVGKNATIYLNATVRNRTSIGEGAVVGMGSVVTKNVPAGATVFGSPAATRGV